ncbi:zinc finger protein 84-like [Thalassophryne amazonica]|uniref:zinc finger protein 84-like n=1 Tax=Thalassophryne amazonica TaxID=390379 RepID=UPI0014716185|nr:zinc finger protein 84-like [Thalassophryne amazonica]
MQYLSVSENYIRPVQQEWNLSRDPKYSELPNIKEEQEELWNEDDDKLQSSQLHHSQRGESTEVELHSSNSTEPRTLKIEAHGEDCGGSQPARDSGPCSHLQPHTDDMHQLWLIKEEILSEQQDLNLIVDQREMKEQKKLWISQQRRQLNQLEGADITNFPYTTVPLKTENDENTQLSQVHQSKSDGRTVTESVASSSTGHRTLTAQTDGEDHGQPQPASHSCPCSPSEQGTDSSSDSSETETDDSCEWKKTRKLHSSFNCETNSYVSVGHSGCNMSNKQFSFSQCGNMNYSKQHARIQANEKPFSCPECGTTFRRKSNLIRHMRIHTGEKPYACSECDKRFGIKGNLTKHLRIHTGQKPFTCFECGERFGLKSSLITHMRTHTGEKPFACTECGKRFGRKSNLVTHMNIHTGQKPFGCSECCQTFGRKGNLVTHMKIHTGQKPVACTECGKRFGRKSNLITHMRIHTGEKPFGCSVCGKEFVLKGHLITHMRIHTGEKPFCCSECDKGFGHKISLIRHMKIHSLGSSTFMCSTTTRTHNSVSYLFKFFLAEMQRLLVSKDDVPPNQQEWNQSLAPKDSELPNIKEEQGELWSEDEGKPQSSQLHQSQREESNEVELHSNNSTEPRTLKIEAHGEDCGGSQPARESDLQPDTDDMQQLLLIKDEILPEQQEWNLSVDQEDIKEEQEKLWISQQRQYLHQLEEADITEFPFTAVPVKTENDNEKSQSSQVHQSQSDESSEAETAASSSSVHRTLTAQSDGEDCGRPQHDANAPFQPDASGRSSDSSETETDDSCEWKQIRELKKSDSVTHNRGNVAKTPFHFNESGKPRGHTNYSKQNTGKQASEKPFNCSECGKRFVQKSSLIRHMRIHSGQKPFICPECGKGCGQKRDLNTHMRIHTGEKPFGCSECGKRFRHKNNLITHMRIHTGEKPFGCSECGKRYGQKCDLNMHMRIHTGQKPFSCCECGKRFGQKSNLITHTRIHTGEKPFGCSECGKSFRQKIVLIRHMVIHTGQKPSGS